MADRKSLSKKLRFEVFKRDSFTCQYCGRKAPDILLEIDHIDPVASGGGNEILNLITSCQDCNAGKSDRKLSDNNVLDKQRAQLQLLQDRKEQIEMMFEWQKGLINLEDDLTDKVADFWAEQVPGYHLNETGLKQLRTLRRRFEVSEILAAIKIAVDHYIRLENGKPTQESVEIAYSKIGGICNNRRLQKDDPELARLHYIRGILRNRLSYFNENLGLQMLQQALEAGASLQNLENHAKEVRNWTQWRNEIDEFISSQTTSDTKDEND